MASFYYDTSKLKKQWTEDALSNYGDYIAEALRSEQLYKDGWCESKIEYFDNKKKEVITLDGRETAPLLVKEDLFQDSKGNPLKFFDAVVGGKSVGTPGTPALLEEAYKRWGKTKWSLLFKDAINLSKNGFVISKKLSSSISRSKNSLSKFKNCLLYTSPSPRD